MQHSLSIALSSAALVALVLLLAAKVSMDSGYVRLRERDFTNGKYNSVGVSQRNALLSEIKERHRGLLPYYNGSAWGFSLKYRKGPADLGLDTLSRTLEKMDEVNVKALNTGAISAAAGCEELRSMRHFEFLGSGYTKLVLKGVLPNSTAVALKSVNRQGVDMKRCAERFGDVEGCYRLVSYKLIKEIVLLQRLQHPNIIKLQGHCYRSDPGVRVTAVLELGFPLEMIQLLQTPWEERFRVCMSLVKLLHYLASSPLGSVSLLDFQPRQFVTVDGELKLSDIDDAVAGELSCREDRDCTLQFPTRNFTSPCSADGQCRGLNEKRNLYNAFRYFFTYLLPHRAPPTLQPLLDRIMNSTGDLSSGINKTMEAFQEILYLYKSGQYLQNVSSSILKDYILLKGFRMKESNDYKCWPSYKQQSCLLSVHNTKEAAGICNSHSQCQGFSVDQQRTWTGRYLASFRSGFGDLIPDVNSAIYVKKGAGFRATT
ncbi:extracellular tyrosine-protein kinase PKDCC-like [Polyodon spathula]|uniref:extracellular tyrosine-protein kinase PKDCC-like n=1 Tax=Polyodon spathula TaxID=7913 RepID=UPI001B7EC158|nr:extracellular tyrosine-protein kinase PKDCC-like [Polyodon spathula]